tara:strand:+ start:380 stop:616 length:237 start_codon:yes stop_codon:yes gene_type:complete
MPAERMMKGGLDKKQAEMVVKAYDKGQISKKQYDNLPPKLLLGIVKKGDSKGGIKEKRTKPSGKRGRPKKGSKVKIEE